MTDIDRDQAIMRAAASLPREIEPERDLWPGIAARLAPRPAAGARSHPWMLALAAGMALVAVTSGLTWQLAKSRFGATPQQTLGTLAAVQARPSVRADAELVYMRAQMLAALETNLARLPAESQRVIVDNLLEIRASLAAIEQALAEDPDNPSLQQLLYTTYHRELDVLADANRVALSLPAEVET